MPRPADLVDAVREQLKSTAVDWATLSIIVEPGRSLVGNAATFITKVIGCKRNDNQKYVFSLLLSYVAISTNLCISFFVALKPSILLFWREEKHPAF